MPQHSHLWGSGSLRSLAHDILPQANTAIPANSLQQYVYAIQEVYNNTNEPTTYVQNSTSGSGGIISSISGFVGASQCDPLSICKCKDLSYILLAAAQPSSPSPGAVDRSNDGAH